ncbi:mediator of RNA polymerase II transcription subunit 11 isoform X2 [Ananas comosus]|uniref:Mediator of RNA polymerase II transcription subunit 11 n=1 Tax=Ananas comosus TaxID=4615 RepID=A0A6P5GPG2_ANACO|nr:mediator of RNA polymerase II transcription subunit 11 isoform X2 [Ananas comosus]
MGPPNQTTSLQRLHHVEKRIVRLLELAGSVMDELANSTGPRTEALTAHCREFMLAIKEIQTTLREEIKSAYGQGQDQGFHLHLLQIVKLFLC